MSCVFRNRVTIGPLLSLCIGGFCHKVAWFSFSITVRYFELSRSKWWSWQIPGRRWSYWAHETTIVHSCISEQWPTYPTIIVHVCSVWIFLAWQPLWFPLITVLRSFVVQILVLHCVRLSFSANPSFCSRLSIYKVIFFLLVTFFSPQSPSATMSPTKRSPTNSSRRGAGEAPADLTTSIASVSLFGHHDGIGEFSVLVRVLGRERANISPGIICIFISAHSTPIGGEHLAARDASKSFCLSTRARFTGQYFFSVRLFSSLERLGFLRLQAWHSAVKCPCPIWAASRVLRIREMSPRLVTVSVLSGDLISFSRPKKLVLGSWFRVLGFGVLAWWDFVIFAGLK